MASAHPSAIGNKGLRVLVVRVGAMGDVLHAVPAVAALRRSGLADRIAWAVDPRWAPLIFVEDDGPMNKGVIDRLHLADTTLWNRRPLSLATLRSVLELRKGLREGRYDVAVDLQGTIRSAVIAWLSGAPRIVGSAAPREAPARWFYTERVPRTGTHVVDQAWDILTAAIPGLSGPSGDTAMSMYPQSCLPVERSAAEWAAKVVEDCGRGTAFQNAPIAFLAPTAGWGGKEWPAQRFGELAAALAGLGFRVLVNATPNAANPVADRVLATARQLAPNASLEPAPATVSQLGALLRRVSVVIAGDTGPLHLAAELGTPAVGLFGPTDPARNGPYGPFSAVLRHPSSVTNHHRYSATEPGLAQISVDEVLAAVDRVRSSRDVKAKTGPGEDAGR